MTTPASGDKYKCITKWDHSTPNHTDLMTAMLGKCKVETLVTRIVKSRLHWHNEGLQ